MLSWERVRDVIILNEPSGKANSDLSQVPSSGRVNVHSGQTSILDSCSQYTKALCDDVDSREVQPQEISKPDSTMHWLVAGLFITNSRESDTAERQSALFSESPAQEASPRVKA